MKYWKQGFYDEPQEGSVEIEDSYYYQLLDGQSSGKEIKEDEHGYPILVEHEYNMEELKAMKVSEIYAYDSSKAVNQFYLSDTPMWIDKATRVGLINSIAAQQKAGQTETTFWHESNSFVLPIEKAISMLNALELYAVECYNNTAMHIASVRNLQTIEEVSVYNYKIGYPEKLQFN